MAITRTAKGTASSKASGTTLILSSVAMTTGELLVVGLAYETDAAITSVKYGKKEMKLVNASGATQGDTRVRIYKKRIHRTHTKDIVITWAANMTARAMFATALTEVGKKDVGQTNTQTATGAPATGSAATSTIPDTISIAAFASLGPSNDTAGSAGVGHTLGQRVGTAGAPPGSNVTLQETYEILSATGNIRATLSGATSRDWANTIVAFGSAVEFTVVNVTQDHRDINEEPDWVRFHMQYDSGAEGFWALMSPEAFDDLSDAEVTEELTKWATYRATRSIDGDSNVTEDSARDTRMATFINDTIKV